MIDPLQHLLLRLQQLQHHHLIHPPIPPKMMPIHPHTTLPPFPHIKIRIRRRLQLKAPPSHNRPFSPTTSFPFHSTIPVIPFVIFKRYGPKLILPKFSTKISNRTNIAPMIHLQRRQLPPHLPNIPSPAPSASALATPPAAPAYNASHPRSSGKVSHPTKRYYPPARTDVANGPKGPPQQNKPLKKSYTLVSWILSQHRILIQIDLLLRDRHQQIRLRQPIQRIQHRIRIIIDRPVHQRPGPH